jgi:hypothetical protein
LKKYFQVLEDKDVSAHCLRHTFCKNLIDQEVKIQEVAMLAGHESMETTRRYTTPLGREQPFLDGDSGGSRKWNDSWWKITQGSFWKQLIIKRLFYIWNSLLKQKKNR